VLSTWLLTGLFAAPLATIVLFLPMRSGNSGARRDPGAGRWPWARRLILALAGTILLAAVVVGVLDAMDVTRRNLVAAVAAIVVVSLAWLPATRRWNARAHLTWAMTFLLFVAYLAFMLDWTLISHLGPAGTVGGMMLWLLEAFAALLGCAYLWELCDALGSEQWNRRIRDGAPPEASDHLPFVSIQVPAYNEPPEMVIETLESLQQMDYPNFEIICLDDNTDDEALWRPLETWCAENGVKFAHLENWPGYKSGALNYALAEKIDPRAELIAVIDSDYQLDPSFLRRCAPLFADPTVGFIQSPQDYRDWEGASFYRRLYYSYKYFFSVSQPSRNERDGAIFAGTMGLIRRKALEEAGGWDEWCITEDAELSLRLLRRGYSGLHVDASFGHGVMPLTFEALKGQRFRWCFGGIQILRKNWRWMLPGRRDRENQLGPGQRWAYLSGAVQWYGDLLALIFFVFLLVGAGNIALHGDLLLRKLTGFLLAAIPLLVLLGLVRAVALLRRGTGASWSDAFGAFMIWQCTSLVVARASVQALYAKEAEFLRTPKTMEEGNFWDAIKGNRGETILGVLGVIGIVGALTNTGHTGLLTAALLLWPTFAFLAAPYNSMAAQRAALPPELAARRRSELARITPKKATVAGGGLVLAGSVAAVVVALIAPGHHPVLGPQLLPPAQGHAVNFNVTSTPSPGSGSPSPGATPSSGTTTSPSGVPTSSTGTTPTPTSSTAPTPSPTSSASPAPSASPTSSPVATSTSAAAAAPGTAPATAAAGDPSTTP
jgi:cellulose synthase/poly-beta-1,6-N-acetylglucosamine synthase-like glycosyltransferase